MVQVKFYGHLRSLIDASEDIMSADRVDRLIRQIGMKYGKDALKAAERSFILLNGKNVALEHGFRTQLKDGDQVQIMPVAAGG